VADQGRGEDYRVLHGEVDLQALAPVVRIGGCVFQPAVLAFVPRHRRLRGCEVYQPEAFDEMQLFRIRRAEAINHGERANPYAHGIDHKRVGLEMANGIAIPGWLHRRGMRSVQAYAPVLVIGLLQDQDLAGRLEDLRRRRAQNERRRLRPALRLRSGKLLPLREIAPKRFTISAVSDALIVSAMRARKRVFSKLLARESHS
jgi:hypothetical protein